MDNFNNWEVTTRTKYDSKKRAKRTSNLLKNCVMLMALTLLVFIFTSETINPLPVVYAEYMTNAGERHLVSIFASASDGEIDIDEGSSNTTSSAISSVPQSGSNSSNSDNETETSNELVTVNVPGYSAENMTDEQKEALEKAKEEEKERKKLLAAKKRKVRLKKKLERMKKNTYKSVPDGFGSVCSYMKWDLITSTDTSQYRLRKEAEHYNSKGMGVINGRFAVAVKRYYGDIGDYINIEYENGEVLKAIIVEQKGRENEPGLGSSQLIYSNSNSRQLSLGVTNKVHTDGSVIEFCVDGSGKTTGVCFAGYGGSRTVAAMYPQYSSDIKGIYKVGNYWD